MESIFDEIEKEAAAYFQKEEQEKARVDRLWVMRTYSRLRSRVSDMNTLLKDRKTDVKLQENARAARKELKLFRLKNNL